eukprot:CAMPEP_0206310210 /NCGR_PEP_ID=MMETSP0106_2-20121207/12798_1 /ASSEMBLY_ACC=CAM_ASM_000206 /TAXON_ID=81532 /ORGANISM="Acanthoeca-like sp., Strain 10tr" /LENGTH=114 /DNA_ID=CAMNT_0053741355 /DNA_START=98 /DNA_END=438 /DNA_ORIENTATION=+
MASRPPAEDHVELRVVPDAYENRREAAESAMPALSARLCGRGDSAIVLCSVGTPTFESMSAIRFLSFCRLRSSRSSSSSSVGTCVRRGAATMGGSSDCESASTSATMSAGATAG